MVIFGSSNWTSPSAAGQVEHNIFTTKPDVVALVRRSVRAQVEQHRRHRSRTRRLRAAAARTRRRIRSRRPARRRRHHADAEVVRRPVGAPLRRLPRHQLGVHDPTLVSANLAETPAKTENQHVQLHAARRARPRDDLLLEGRRQDDGASKTQVERGVELHDRRRRRRHRPRPPTGTLDEHRALRVGSAAAGRRVEVESMPPPPAARRSGTPMRARQRSPPRQRHARQLLRADVHRRSRPRLSAVDARQGRQQQLGERLGVRAVHELGDQRPARRSGGSARPRPPK